MAFYLLGTTLGGAALGGAAGLGGVVLRRASHLSGSVALVAVAAGAVAALMLDARGARPVPSVRRQVNEDWLRRYRSWVYGMGFGLQLGAALPTIVTSAASYLMVVVAVLSPTFASAVVIGTVYGLARGLPILATARVTSFTQLGRLHERLSSLRPAARRMTLGTELLVALVAAGGAVINR